MGTNEREFFRNNPEGAVIVALDSQKDGLLFGALELRGGERTWLDYELESSQDGDMVSLYRETEDTPLLEYRAKDRRVDVTAHPGRLLILWNQGRRVLAVGGGPLSPGDLSASIPEGVTPWLLRFASWLPGRGRGKE